MESRCFDGEIAFLEGTKIRSIREMLMAIGMITLVAAVMIF
jgi:hypothetical protein